jgi:hypothetical protein
MISKKRAIEERLKSLEDHLGMENPVLLDAVKGFRELDRVAYATGLLSRDDSYAMKIPWWPMISVLGTFSSGKSTFINDYVGGSKLQSTGNQAVDDKFTVICFSRDEDGRVLPGLALDADIRFPFYRISSEIDKVAAGEGHRIDAYLQLKASSSPVLRGKILIDSPGFDADDQRTSTLRITDHIIDLSDLVLVFFDARHPEPGAMQDTLDHLVERTIHRSDSNKFLYILNQIDTTAREDNPEDVVGAWQRALSQKGLTAGRFYCIYNEAASVPIDDDNRRRRFQSKRDEDLRDIHRRIDEVEEQRAYRIIGSLEKAAQDVEALHIPAIKGLLVNWSKRVLWTDAAFYGLIVLLLLGSSIALGYWDGWRLTVPWLQSIGEDPALAGASVFVVFLAAVALHFYSRSLIRNRMVKRMQTGGDETYLRAFEKNTRVWRSLFRSQPVGWGRRAKRRIGAVLVAASDQVQKLNDQFTNLSGGAPSAQVARLPSSEERIAAEGPPMEPQPLKREAQH